MGAFSCSERAALVGNDSSGVDGHDMMGRRE